MEIKNLKDRRDVITIVEDPKYKGYVYLKVGEGPANRHAHLLPSEAKAIAHALLSYAEQVASAE